MNLASTDSFPFSKKVTQWNNQQLLENKQLGRIEGLFFDVWLFEPGPSCSKVSWFDFGAGLYTQVDATDTSYLNPFLPDRLLSSLDAIAYTSINKEVLHRISLPPATEPSFYWVRVLTPGSFGGFRGVVQKVNREGQLEDIFSDPPPENSEDGSEDGSGDGSDDEESELQRSDASISFIILNDQRVFYNQLVMVYYDSRVEGFVLFPTFDPRYKNITFKLNTHEGDTAAEEIWGVTIISEFGSGIKTRSRSAILSIPRTLISDTLEANYEGMAVWTPPSVEETMSSSVTPTYTALTVNPTSATILSGEESYSPLDVSYNIGY